LSAVLGIFFITFQVILELKRIGAFAPELKELDVYHADSAQNNRFYSYRVLRRQIYP